MIPAELADLFDNPARDFGPTPLWWWSGARVDSDRLRFQLEQFCSGGIYNLVVINLAPAGPIVGGRADDPAWFSDTWWDRFAETCAIARELGMRIWFYDQIGFSGANVQGGITHRHPEAAGMALHSHLIPGGDPIVAPVGETLLAAFGSDARRLPAAGVAASEVRIVTTVPTAFDYLQPRAVDLLLDAIHRQFDERVPQYLGNVIAGSFQDELPATNSWTPGFADEFRERMGYDLLDHLPSLWVRGGARDAKVRGDYYRVRGQLTEEALFRPLGQWHTERGLLIGADQTNPARAGNPTQATQLYTDYFRTHRWYNAAGSDHEGDAKVHSSMAHLYGHERVWIESFHSSGWGGTLEETYDWLLPFLRAGANLYNPHASYFGTAGGWFEWAPPSTDWRQPYWRQYPAFSRAVARIASMMSWGSYVADVALLYPSATSQALLTIDSTIDHFGDGRIGGDFSEVDETQDHYLELAGANNWFETKPGLLDTAGIAFDVIDDDSIQRADAAHGSLRVRDLAYSTVILPSASVLEEGTAQRLTMLLDAGGRVVVVGRAPSFAAGTRGDDAVVRALAADPRVISVRAPAEAISALGEGRGYATSDVPLLVRRSGIEAIALVTAAFPSATAYPLRSQTWLWEDYDFDRRRYAPARAITVAAPVASATALNPATGEKRDLKVSVDNGVSTIEVPLDGAPAMLVAWTEGAPPTASGTPAAGGQRHSADISDGWRGALVATMDNRYGDMALPAGADVSELEVWTVHWSEGDGTPEPIAVTAGQRVLVSDPVATGDAPAPLTPAEARLVADGSAGLGALPLGPDSPGSTRWREVVYSSSRGEARQGESSLGNKGLVPEEFVRVLAPVAGETAVVRAVVHTGRSGEADLVVGAGAPKRVWLNGVELAAADGYSSVLRVRLTEPVNVLEYRLGASANSVVASLSGAPPTLGSFFTVVEPGGWGARPEFMTAGPGVDPDGRVTYSREFDVPVGTVAATLIVGAATGLSVWLDGAPIARQEKVEYYESSWGATPMYFAHDLTSRIGAGRHTLEIVADSVDARDVVFVDLVVRHGSGTTALVSGSGWATASGTTTGRSAEYGGHWAELISSHAATRTHPLPEVGWIHGAPVIGSAATAVSASVSAVPAVQRFTVRLPAGSTAVTLPLRVAAEVAVDGVPVPLHAGAIALPAPLERPADLVVVTDPTAFARGGAAFSGPLVVSMVEAPIALGRWDGIGLRSWSGGVRYTRRVDFGSDGGRVELDLGQLRGSVEVEVDGQSVGEAFCAPFRFDLGKRSGVGELSVTVYNTLGPFFEESTPTRWVFPSQRESGLSGPVTLTTHGHPEGH